MSPAAEPPASFPPRFPWPGTSRAIQWRTSRRTLTLPRVPLVMGILNVTPDSFSDGGQSFLFDAAVERGRQLVRDGADLLDIGGESTRPYSDPVSANEERRRVLPVIEALAHEVPIPISIDTTKASVARVAMAAGAEIINDVSGLTGDPDMVAIARETGAGLCVMHMLGTPQTMQDDPRYEDVVRDVLEYLRTRRETLLAAGIERERIALDPGIGFGKSHQHNLDLLAACGRFHELGCPLLVGHSRKGFIAKVLGNKEANRTPGTIGVALALALSGVQIVRVHDVAAVRQAFQLFEATGGFDGRAANVE